MRIPLLISLAFLSACSDPAPAPRKDAETATDRAAAKPVLNAPVEQVTPPDPTVLANSMTPKVTTPKPSALSAPPPPAAPAPPMGFYRAVGTEPFWAASIAAGSLSLSRPDETVRSFDVTLTEKGGVRRYAGEGIAMTANPAPCSDGMSDASYPDRVQIAMGDTTLKGCGGAPTGRPSAK